MNLNKNLDKDTFSEFGTKAIEEVENIASDAYKKVSAEVSDFTSRALTFVKKNPVLTAAALLTVGLIIVKVMSKSTDELNEDASDELKKESDHITH